MNKGVRDTRSEEVVIVGDRVTRWVRVARTGKEGEVEGERE